MRRKPRKCKYVKAIPRILLSSKDGSIDIREYTVTITGSVESAALAMAEDILRRRKNQPDSHSLNYRCIEVYIKDKEYILSLKHHNAMKLDDWNLLKKNVEKICNDLVAFM